MKTLIATLALLLAASCGHEKRDMVMVEVIQTPFAREHCSQLGTTDEKVLACTEVIQVGDETGPVLTCKIFIRPEDVNQWEPGILGHELRHCIEGQFHN